MIWMIQLHSFLPLSHKRPWTHWPQSWIIKRGNRRIWTNESNSISTMKFTKEIKVLIKIVLSIRWRRSNNMRTKMMNKTFSIKDLKLYSASLTKRKATKRKRNNQKNRSKRWLIARHLRHHRRSQDHTKSKRLDNEWRHDICKLSCLKGQFQSKCWNMIQLKA